MQQEPKAGRRIVSRGEYVKVQAKRLRLYLCAVITFIASLLLVCNVVHWHIISSNWSALLTFGIIVMVWCGKLKTVKQWYQEAQKVPAVTPLTRANTADLPAPDSLVRASQEPAQAQEGVLLRAASGEAQAGQEGQLLRASVGGQE